MAGARIEIIQAPSGGINSDASADYVGPVQAANLENFLPSLSGKTIVRGSIIPAKTGAVSEDASPAGYWVLGDSALMRYVKLSDSTYEVRKLVAVNGTIASTDVTATIGETPINGAHSILGSSCQLGTKAYGMIDDTNAPALGSWDGGATITAQTNAPYQFTAICTHLQRVWVLGGTVPGASASGTPNTHTIYWTDPGATDLSALDAWKDDVSGLVNRIDYQADDTPVGLVSFGTTMAIVGTRSINILAGSSAANFAIRNLTKGWGAISLDSIVAAEDGFWFLSERGMAFCDGTTVRVVSDNAVTRELLDTYSAFPVGVVACAWSYGYIAVSLAEGTATLGKTLVYDTAHGVWFRVSSQVFSDNYVYPIRTNSYSFCHVGSDIWRVDAIGSPTLGQDFDGTDLYSIPATYRSRALRLGSPLSKAAVANVVVDHATSQATESAVTAAAGLEVQVLDVDGTALATAHTEVVTNDSYSTVRRQRLQFPVYGEVDTLQLSITWSADTPAPEMNALEVYDAWVEFTPAQRTAGF